jgi:hypothetical protein
MVLIIVCPFIKKCKHVARAAIRAPLAALWRVFYWRRLASQWPAAIEAWDRLAGRDNRE